MEVVENVPWLIVREVPKCGACAMLTGVEEHAKFQVRSPFSEMLFMSTQRGVVIGCEMNVISRKRCRKHGGGGTSAPPTAPIIRPPAVEMPRRLDNSQRQLPPAKPAPTLLYSRNEQPSLPPIHSLLPFLKSSKTIPRPPPMPMPYARDHYRQPF